MLKENTTPDPARIDELDVIKSLTLAVEYLINANVLGHVGEFGSKNGQTGSIICKAFQRFSEIYSFLDEPVRMRHMHFFDSFEGLPEITDASDLQSPHVAANVWFKGSCRADSGPEALRGVLNRYVDDKYIHVHSGWFSETLPTIPEDLTFGMLHIDCDLYSSSMDVLDFLFTRIRINHGCVICFDDYNCNQADPRFGERKAWRELTAKYQVEYSDCGAYGWHGHKFIVHSYRT